MCLYRHAYQSVFQRVSVGVVTLARVLAELTVVVTRLDKMRFGLLYLR